MPIAKFQMPDGKIARFEVPEGTTPEQAQAQIQQMVSGGLPEQPQAPAQQAGLQPQDQFIDVPQPTGEIGVRGVDLPPTQPKDDGFLGASVIEPAATMISGAIAEPIAGLSGLGALPFDDTEKATANIEAVRNALTYIPRTKEGMESLKGIAEFIRPLTEKIEAGTRGLGEAGFEAGGAGLGTIAATIPSAALEALPAIGAIKRGIKGAERGADIAATTTKPLKDGDIDTRTAIDTPPIEKTPIDEIKSEPSPETQDYDKILDNLKNKKVKKAVIDAMPDKDILDAADELGVDLNPDHYSSNRVFRELTQKLKDRPASKLGMIEEKAISDLGKRADDLINEIGGQTDKSLLDARIKDNINSTIDDLEEQAKKAYQAVDSAIPKNVKVKPISSRNYIAGILDDLGGDKSLLSSAESQLLRIMETNPTYTALDRLRKDVGNGFRKKQGPYKDDNSGTLKQVYRVLSEDQQGVSDVFGVGADYSAARKLVASRKGIEDNAIKLFGREANSSIVPKITAAATALTKGDTSKFNTLMKSLPKSMRQEAAATMLNDLFTHGARNKDALGGGFVAAWKGLNRNEGAKNIIFNELPPIAKDRFNKIGIVANGIYRSKALENTSKTAASLISAMDDMGVFAKVYDVGKKAAVAEGVSSSVGLTGVGSASVLAATIAKGRTPASQAADSFIVSKKFKDAVETAARTGNPKTADKILKTSKEYKKWKGFLNKEQAARLAAVGFIPYITGQIEIDKEGSEK